MTAKFQVGKCYQHASGLALRIIEVRHLFMRGPCFIGQDKDGSLFSVSGDDSATTNWEEIPKLDMSVSADIILPA